MKIKEQAQKLHEVYNLIQSMMHELQLSRGLLYRMYKTHGVELYNDLIQLDDSIQFNFEAFESGYLRLTVSDVSKIGMRSNFEKIKQQYKEIM